MIPNDILRAIQPANPPAAAVAAFEAARDIELAAIRDGWDAATEVARRVGGREYPWRPSVALADCGGSARVLDEPLRLG